MSRNRSIGRRARPVRAARWRRGAAALGLAGLLARFITTAAAQDVSPLESLNRLSLDELSHVQVTSVSKAPESLSQANATIYVISQEEIVRSGATSLPEALRLAPNLLVTQLSATDYVVSARGMGGNPADQNFSNKILMLIDGRSVYSPLYSGVYLDAQNVMLQDIERIEVISGPGATLWGANAMNGVINIITRSAAASAGGFVSVNAGTSEQDVNARIGGTLDDHTAFRVYSMAMHRGAEALADGTSAGDGWDNVQGGFRIDRTLARDSLTLQGDLYRATENELDTRDGMLSGANLLMHWDHQGEHSEWQLKTYFDQTEQFAPAGGLAFVLDTYDVELQENLAVGSAQRIVWGVGERVNVYGITNSETLLFDPSHRALTLGNVFGQDTFELGHSVALTAGLKAEDDAFSGWAVLPDVRLSYQPGSDSLIWVAGSRSIRSPTPFDHDVAEKLGDVVYLTGNANFLPERLDAYEIGWRSEPISVLSLSVSGFYHDYDQLRSIEPASSTVFLPLDWGNLLRGTTYGIDAWARWQITDHWRVTPGFTALHEHFKFEPAASGLTGLAQAADDPSSHAYLSSSFDALGRLTLDGTLRYVGALPAPALPAYYELDVRGAWKVSSSLEVSLMGSNLLHARHLEFPVPYGEYIERNVGAQVQWRH
ncbi:MAG: TonB-dependent receptor [Steroidobacteraceae bacterium]|jgi:iron complex outermembrane receptor protein